MPGTNRTRVARGLALVVALVLASCARREDAPVVRVFHAAGFSPFLRQVRDECARTLRVDLQTEGSGSVEACRKITSLGRTCDVLVLADNQLVKPLLGGVCTWRIDFATDEVVIGIGARAPHVEQAERGWAETILGDDVRLARADENGSPIGYRTLLVLKLQERLGSTGIYDRFLTRCQKKVDDVERLAALLKSGDIDYAFLYRSTCVAHGIRHIELDARINLGSMDVDYGQAEVRFAKLKSGSEEMVTVRGTPTVWTMAQPEAVQAQSGRTGATLTPGPSPKGRGGQSDALAGQEHANAAARFAPGAGFIRHVLAHETEALTAIGFRPLARPRFYGPPQAYRPFVEVAAYAGELK
jgi:molybdate/tungstate transport system substrate-binding protein